MAGGWGRCAVLGAVLSVSKGPKLCGLVSRKGGVLVIRSIDTRGGHFPTCKGRGVVSLTSVTVCAGSTRIPLHSILRSVGRGRGTKATSVSPGGTATRRLHTCLARMLPSFSHREMCVASVGGLVS